MLERVIPLGEKIQFLIGATGTHHAQDAATLVGLKEGIIAHPFFMHVYSLWEKEATAVSITVTIQASHSVSGSI